MTAVPFQKQILVHLFKFIPIIFSIKVDKRKNYLLKKSVYLRSAVVSYNRNVCDRRYMKLLYNEYIIGEYVVTGMYK